MSHAVMPEFPLFLYEGLSEVTEGLSAFILLPATINKTQQCVLKSQLIKVSGNSESLSDLPPALQQPCSIQDVCLY